MHIRLATELAKCLMTNYKNIFEFSSLWAIPKDCRARTNYSFYYSSVTVSFFKALLTC